MVRKENMKCSVKTSGVILLYISLEEINKIIIIIMIYNDDNDNNNGNNNDYNNNYNNDRRRVGTIETMA